MDLSQEATKRPCAAPDQGKAEPSPERSLLALTPQDPVMVLGQPQGSAQGYPPVATWPAKVEIQHEMTTAEDCVGTAEKSPKRIPRRDHVNLKNCLMDP